MSEINNQIRRSREDRDGNENDENRNPNEALERNLSQLEAQHKLPRRLILTLWLSSAEAIKVVTTSRDTYKICFAEESSENGREIYDLLYDDVVFGWWYYCLLVRRLASADRHECLISVASSATSLLLTWSVSVRRVTVLGL